MSHKKKLLRSNPAGGKNIESWDAMLELKAQGKAKAVGVSNFGVSHLQGLKDAGRELPYDRSYTRTLVALACARVWLT